MTQELKAGSRLRSAVCDTEVIVVRAPSDPVVLECGGVPMAGAESEVGHGASPSPDRSEGTLIGKRYEGAGSDLEVLCTKGGTGSLSIDGTPLEVKGSKALPSSD